MGPVLRKCDEKHLDIQNIFTEKIFIEYFALITLSGGKKSRKMGKITFCRFLTCITTVRRPEH